MSRRYCALLVYLLGFRWAVPIGALVQASSSSSSSRSLDESFSRKFQVQRTIMHRSVDQSYHRCLQGWSHDNLGFPWWIPPPAQVKWPSGEINAADNGVGLIITRIPPLALQEGIVDCRLEPDGTKLMEYRILNPGWFTWPVQNHRGTIQFKPLGTPKIPCTSTNNDKDEQHRHLVSSTTDTNGCQLDWTVEWTPIAILSALQDPWDWIVEKAMTSLIECAADYVGKKDFMI